MITQIVARWLYTLLFYLLLPALVLRMWLRGRQAAGYRARWRERFGWVTPCKQPCIWVHSVSVGEVAAAEPVIRYLLRAFPKVPLLVTCMTPTGAERLQHLFGNQIRHAYMPYDLPVLVRRFVQRAKPCALIIMETELWPNLLQHCADKAIPVSLVNARLSEKSARGYARIGYLSRPMLQHLGWIAAQSEADAQRFVQLGVPATRVTVTGSVKFDLVLSPEIRQQAAELRAEIGERRPVWLAASTHEGEEAIVLQAHRQLLLRFPRALLILVPRHPERFEAVAALVLAQQLALVRRSHRASIGQTQVLLGDTMGELLMLLGAADMAFIGASLVERGGHNPLEAAVWGIPVISGPHVFNFVSVYQRLLEGGGLSYAGSADSLAARLEALMADPPWCQQQGAQALAAIEANRGALQRVVVGLAVQLKALNPVYQAH